MRFALLHPRELFSRKSLPGDLKAGVVLGIEGVPDSMSSGVLAAINPIAAVYAGIFGIAASALFSSSVLMPVQATGAMSIVVRDVRLGRMDNPTGALAMLTLMTGAIMILAGVLRLGAAVRFVSRSVTTGFIAAVGVNIILGQFYDITLFKTEGRRLSKGIQTILHIFDWHWSPVAVAAVTAAVIVVLRRTRIGGLAYVVAVVVSWVMAYWMNHNGHTIILVRDDTPIPSGLPLPIMPDFGKFLILLVPALSLAFVGLVQGAGVASSVENPDGSPTNASQDFIGQGAGNIASGLFRGMPVGGSASGTVLNEAAGAGSRAALFLTSLTMAILVMTIAPVVAMVPLSGLAGMLVIVGLDTIPIPRIKRILKTGRIPTTVMTVTFILTMLIPLQFAVIVGIGFSIVLFVIGESARLDLKRIIIGDDGIMREVEPPAELGSHEVVLIQPYGTLFFASADELVGQLPQPGPDSKQSAVILRLRGEQAPSVTLVERMARYAKNLNAKDCRFIVVTTSEELVQNLGHAEAIDEVHGRGTYLGDDRIGVTARKAVDDAQAWINAAT